MRGLTMRLCAPCAAAGKRQGLSLAPALPSGSVVLVIGMREIMSRHRQASSRVHSFSTACAAAGESPGGGAAGVEAQGGPVQHRQQH